jgi:hypothetical protein
MNFKSILKKSDLNSVMLLYSSLYFPLFLGGKRKGVKNNQLSNKTG